MSFELLVAVRYLKAKRKHAAISVITLVSIAGVAAGVAALVIALAINAGFREYLQEKLLATTQPHVTLSSLEESRRIEGYRAIVTVVEAIDGVVAVSPVTYDDVLLTSRFGSHPIRLKGVISERESRISDLTRNITEGSLEGFDQEDPDPRKRPPIVIGYQLAETLGVKIGDRVEMLSANSRETVPGVRPAPVLQIFQVSAIFKSDFYDYDNNWAYIPLAASQRMLRIEGAAMEIDIKLRDLNQAKPMGEAIEKAASEASGRKFHPGNWIDNNARIFKALELERIVVLITIGLIVMVAALNIVGSLTMMVLEKSRDIAILMAMGATAQSIRKIFIWQGVIIGVVGTGIGLVLGHVVSTFAEHFRLIRVDPSVYSVDYVPFRTNLWDSLVIAVVAIVISYLATLYPSAEAAKLEPVETLRYE